VVGSDIAEKWLLQTDRWTACCRIVRRSTVIDLLEMKSKSMVFLKNGQHLPVKWLVLLAGWWVFAEACMRMRISDGAASSKFSTAKVALHTANLQVNHSNLHYAKAGVDSLPTLFFVHGSPGSWNAFMQYMLDSDLLKRFRIVSVDRPGFGYSNFGKAQSLAGNASSLLAVVLHEKNGKPVHLIGHSIGGPVVVKMAQQAPELFSSVTVLAGSISPFSEPREQWRGIVKSSVFRWLLPGAFRPSNDEIWEFKRELFLLDSGYQQLKMPVTFIHGDKDPFVSVENADYGMQKLTFNTGARKIIIPGANHFIPWQQYDLIKAHLIKL
jgi:pimeloyl-ACP methyl ester carboxylesterase